MIELILNQRITKIQLIVNERKYTADQIVNNSQLRCLKKTSDINKSKLDQHLQYHYLDKKKLYLNIIIK